MFIHQFKYAFTVLFRDKSLIFWTFAFPLIMATFFHLAFSDIENREQLGTVPIAVVENEDFIQSEVWKEAFAALSCEAGEEGLFQTQYVSLEEAETLLNQKEIAGYFILSQGEPKVVVSSDGIEETVLKYAVEEISQTEEIVQNVAAYEIQAGAAASAGFFAELYQEILDMTEQQAPGIREIPEDNLSYTMIEYYTLIAMTCLYGGILGMAAVNQNLANMSKKGRRVSVSPISKGKMILGSVLAAYVTSLIGVALLFAYTAWVLKVDYGDRLPLIVLLTLCGCLAGLSLGVAVAVLVKANENTKTGIIISITMAGCFLSGMMGITMKYIIDKNVPLLNRLNPANMITDGLYALYYYDTLERFALNAASLLCFALVMLLLSVSGLRRQTYDCI